MKRIDLTGLTFGPYYVKEYIGNKKYRCICTCGKEEILSTQVIKRQSGLCKHTENDTSKLKYDLTGQHFGDWTVLYYKGKQLWHCRCSCGKEQDILSTHLRTGQTKSCGHNTTGFKDLTGLKFNEWTVLKYLGNQMWLCQCSCGKTGEVSSYDLRNNKSKSCGHLTNNQFIDLTGKTFGEWTVLSYAGEGFWNCKCSCGTESMVDGRSLRSGASKSCGHGKYLDIAGQEFNDWTAIEYLGKHNWLCMCSCGRFGVVTSQRLRNGISKSCGCKRVSNLEKTIKDKYGVDNISKLHLTAEQLDMTSSCDKVLNVISNMKCSVTPKNLSNILGITPCQVMRVVRKYGLEHLVELSKPISTYEEQINGLFPCTNRSDKSILDGKEIDLYYPEYNLGIEFNGSYWHSTEFKPKDYHINKTKLAAQKGVQLIHIFEYEWNDADTQEKLIGLLSRKLKSNEQIRLGARECEVRQIQNKDTIEILNKYHLQGYVPASIIYGMYYKDEIIGVMTFGKPRFNNKEQYELIRLVWNPKYIVSGGSERLLSRFIKDYDPMSIISYCDMSKFSGQSYMRLGFKATELSKPNYKWVEPETNKVLSRYQTMKSKLVKDGLGIEEQTEDEIMKSLGYLKIYDCGNMIFTWNKDSKV